MEITDIKVKKIKAKGKLRAYVSVTFDHCFVVHDIKVVEGRAGLIVVMPNKQMPKGEYKDIAHPIKAEFRLFLESAVKEAYDNEEDEVKVEKLLYS